MFNQPIAPGSLPIHLTTLVLGQEYNQPFALYSLPESLTNLDLGFTSFNHQLLTGSLPTSLTSLSLGRYFNQPLLSGTFPSSLRSLVFGQDFNQSLTPVGGPHGLPHSLTSLIFGASFNQPIEDGTLTLPLLTYLMFGSHFNQALLPGSLPPSLTKIVLGFMFNQEVHPNSYPNTLKHMTFPRLISDRETWANIPRSVQTICTGAPIRWLDSQLRYLSDSIKHVKLQEWLHLFKFVMEPITCRLETLSMTMIISPWRPSSYDGAIRQHVEKLLLMSPNVANYRIKFFEISDLNRKCATLHLRRLNDISGWIMFKLYDKLERDSVPLPPQLRYVKTLYVTANRPHEKLNEAIQGLPEYGHQYIEVDSLVNDIYSSFNWLIIM
ncbi:hypothetical protein SAMD00019534_121240 [Acytostelium subglobosum LB1]|uniref:hypothetical protein n=1 Tax=Acytostelium subglobosum LB1 TaxID=1410327 RepID=UPI0006451733|nr:hypothetical protein SAMD00019534_121240 [Acytostelium subglobosum LB1]GAM28948.1 hypothetical protein SAMD00019534_121240 [Acytostelium subglobosum LB1]|eukprot:XP_012748133.1 hypothetical protein SAMD00019534_121240 [Acytostelium subglobosum LB1]